jgi:hypothetical protein
VQNYVVLTGGLGAAANEADAGKALLNFIIAPAAIAVFKAKGMEPVTP